MTPLPLAPYPDAPSLRTRWIVERRGARRERDPLRPYAAFVEEEIGPDGMLWRVATLFLTNRECAFRCLMCDLWQDTLDTATVPGAIPAQIESALTSLPAARAVKLYNAGSFFDPGQIPEADYPAIAARVSGFERVIVECHTAFLRGEGARRARTFRDTIKPAQLEVAIGLETVHPEVLQRLNKRMTVADFERAAAFLKENGIALRVFLLVGAPFLTEVEDREWTRRSLDAAHAAGASFVALLPVRAGNGALEALQAQRLWMPPSLEALEAAQEYGQSLTPTMRVTADLWEIERFVQAPDDSARITRIAARNQSMPPGASAQETDPAAA